jgi:hypothetical protein
MSQLIIAVLRTSERPRSRAAAPNKRPAPLSAYVCPRRNCENIRARLDRPPPGARDGKPKVSWYRRRHMLMTRQNAQETTAWWEEILEGAQGP